MKFRHNSQKTGQEGRTFGMFRKFRRPKPEEGGKRHTGLVGIILMAVGTLTILYFLVTYVLIPILAALTPGG